MLLFAAPAGAAGDSPVSAKPPLPCVAPEFHQFDFWIGEWNVTTLDGKHAGWNVIKRELGGCVLTENWTGASGTTGRSFNIYTPEDGHWHQSWVDSHGLLLQLSGGLVAGDMVMSGTTRDAKGAEVLNRITWHKVDDDHVRQHWEQSSDGGTTWTEAFLGIYTRRQLEGAR
jgi:hypothetical protein